MALFQSPDGEFFLDVLPPIQHAHDLRRIIDHAVEDDMRRGGERSQSGAQLISTTSRKRMFFDQHDHFGDFAEYFSAVFLPATLT